MLQLRSDGTYTSSFPKARFDAPIQTSWLENAVGESPTTEQQSHTGKLCLDRDLTHTGLNAIHQDSISSSPLDSTHNSEIINSHHENDSVLRNYVLFLDQNVAEPTGASIARTTDGSTVSDQEDTIAVEKTQIGSLMDRPDSMCADHVDDSVLQISGAGHWFLEGWIGDHSVEFLVEFLVDSGSSVTAMSDWLYQTLVRAGALVGALGCTSRTLRGAKGTRIGVLGCSHCVVSFMGLRTEFPILVCDLAADTDAIIGTDVLGSVLPHTLACYLQTGVPHCSYIGLTPPFPATARYHHIQKL